MKAINAVFFYISLAIALCSPNVSTYCGNDEQIDDLRTAMIKQESVSTVLTTLSAIPVTGATLTVAQIMISGRFLLHLNEVFEEMKSSLNKNHRNYKRCSEIMEMSKAANTAIKPFSYAFSLTSFIPGLGMVSLVPRLLASIRSMLFLREKLISWQKAGCQYATTRDCNL